MLQLQFPLNRSKVFSDTRCMNPEEIEATFPHGASVANLLTNGSNPVF
jgi:hypothetical protein